MHSQQARDCKLLSAPIKLKPTPVLVGLEVFEEVPITISYIFFNICGARSNEPTNQRLQYKLVDRCI